MLPKSLPRPTPPPPFGGRARLLSLGTIVLVFVMVATAIIGFAHISTQQRALAALRAQSQELVAVLQAVLEADAGATHAILGERDALAGHAQALTLLGSERARILAGLDDIPGPDGLPLAPLAAVETLRSAWADAVRLAGSGRSAEAGALLGDRNTRLLVAALGDAVEAVLANTERQLASYEGGVALGTLMVVLLQVAGGTLAIVGLISAFRSSAREGEARAAAVETADKSREQVARLFDMADVLQSATDHADANAVLRATAADLLPGFPGAFYVFNSSRDRLVLSSAWGLGEDDALPETVNPGGCWALKRGKPHLNRGDGGLCCAHHAGSAMVLEIPMIARGEIVGLLQLFAEGEEAEMRLDAITDIGSALRERLRNQALRDPLTGLYNRRYMEDCLARFIKLAERESREMALLMVDLDRFKRLNDEHGHVFGDQVLRDVAMALVEGLRETDVVCRYGGEELVVILPDCSMEAAADKAEALRQRIEELSLGHGAEISASFGVAAVPHSSGGIADLLSAADAALYKAKQGGRNQVVCAPLRPFRTERSLFEETPRIAAE